MKRLAIAFAIAVSGFSLARATSTSPTCRLSAAFDGAHCKNAILAAASVDSSGGQTYLTSISPVYPVAAQVGSAALASGWGYPYNEYASGFEFGWMKIMTPSRIMVQQAWHRSPSVRDIFMFLAGVVLGIGLLPFAFGAGIFTAVTGQGGDVRVWGQ